MISPSPSVGSVKSGALSPMLSSDMALIPFILYGRHIHQDDEKKSKVKC